MRRAAVRALRTTCQGTGLVLSRSSRTRTLRASQFNKPLPVSSARLGSTRPFTSSAPLPVKSSSTAYRPRSQPQYALGEPLRSSMYTRRLTVALVSGLVGYGAWYGYKGTTTTEKAIGRQYSTVKTSDDSAPLTRNVLVVGADELHTGTFVGEGPIAKSADGSGGNVLEMLTPDQATDKLRDNDASFTVNRGQGVLRYDCVQLASNNPIEDDHAEKIVEVALPNRDNAEQAHKDWMFWGVFDGHAGWTTSAKLRSTLISFVARELNTTYKAASTLGVDPSPEAIDTAIKTGFTRLDHEIVHESVEKVMKSNSKLVAAELLGPALSGSCALLSFYDSSSKTLRVACTGDSRAVLGRRSDSNAGKWTAVPLSEDQTGSNPHEEERMRKAHPGEDKVIYKGRVLGGLEPTRAFGDASYKWTREIANRLSKSFFARSQSPLLKTPPYVTAEPVVTTTKIQPERGDFVVMATDGLWEMLTNEEVVGLVGKWIESHGSLGPDSSTSASSGPSYWSKLFGSSSQGLPVEVSKPASAVGGGGHGYGAAGDDGQKTPIRVQQWGLSPDWKERFVVKDKNVATHLVRNALGGKNEEQVCALLTLVSPFSRRYRDDLTVQVIFFGNGPDTREVLVNRDASSPPKSAIKAKL